MSSRPDPPPDSQELAEYSAGDRVYYYRAGKWRGGEIQGKGGSSEDSPRYLVKDDEKQDERLVADSDIRKA